MNVKKIIQGDEKAFLEMVAQYAPSIRAYLVGRLYGHQDLEDIVQEVFIAAFQGRKSLKDKNKIESWLKGIARNKLKLFYRTQSRRQKMTLSFKDFVVASIDENFDDHPGSEEKKILQYCIKKLPEKLRKLVNLRHLSGVRVKDLAKKEDCSETQVSVNLFRAREKLKDCVEKNL